jgi:hypothetical protein
MKAFVAARRGPFIQCADHLSCAVFLLNKTLAMRKYAHYN